jgi:tight adherence protein B
MIAMIIVILTFTAAFLAVFSANLILLDIIANDQNRLKKRIGEELLKRERERARESTQHFKDLGQLAAEAIQEASDEPSGLIVWFKSLVEQSGLNLTPGKLVAIMSGSGLCLGALGTLIFVNWIVGILCFAVGALIPLLVVQFKRHKRLELLRSQLSDTFDLMARILRAGQSMPQAMQAVSQEFKPPVALEFAYCYEQQNLGLAPEYALRDLARRTGLLEIKIFVLALLVHQQTGGNLTEILENLAFIVRDRFRIRGMIASLTAEGRVQAGILLVLPPAMFVILLFVNREYALKLFNHPILPILSLTFMGLGAIWIRKIVNFDF